VYSLFKKNEKFQFIYAGAMLPNAYGPLESIFNAIAENTKEFKDVEFHFIGTGYASNNELSFNIKPLAEKYRLWEKVVFEYPKRIPYLDVLVHLSLADSVFILGSTEPHYTPSKTYQGVLSEKPIFAVLHEKSTAAEVIDSTGAGQTLCFNGIDGLEDIEIRFVNSMNQLIVFAKEFDPKNVNHSSFDEYSAKSVTAKLVGALDCVVP
jgi:hypothetical protein